MADPTNYAPLDTLKPVADDIFIVDGPTIRFGPPLMRMPFPTRMTVVRLAGGGLLLHSPTHLTPSLKAEIDALGPPRALIGPNRIHYWWIPDWHAAYPEAEPYLAPRIRAQSKGRITFPARDLDAASGYPWDGEIDTLPIAGRYMTEVVFFHRKSRTLILTDLIENFESSKLSWWMRIVARLGGALDPHGSMPRDMRLTFEDRAALKRAVEQMIAWDPERVILAHGRWYQKNGADELRRAFRWLLD